MSLTIERLSNSINIYKLYINLLRKNIDCSLYFNDKYFTLKFAKNTNLVVTQNNDDNFLTYQNHTRTVKNLTYHKCFERILKILEENDNEQKETQEKLNKPE